MEFFQVV